MRLLNKIVFVTNAQNPCTEAIVMNFAREGAGCYAGDDAAVAERLAEQVRSVGRRALALQSDVTKMPQVEEAIRLAVGEFGRIDELLNCFGITHEDDFLQFSEDSFNRCIDRGPKAYFLVWQAVGRQMTEQRSGKIINLSSTDPPHRFRPIGRKQRRLFNNRRDDASNCSGSGILRYKRQLACLRTNGFSFPDC